VHLWALHLTTTLCRSMSFFSKRKKISPSNTAFADGLTSHSTQRLPPRQLPSPPESQSHTPQQEQRAQPVYPWSTRHLNLLPPTRLIKDAHPSGPSPSPFPRHGHALSPTASAAGGLFLFGGIVHDSPCNDLYAFSTKNFSVTLLQTRGEIPSPRVRHAGALSSSGLLIWGGDMNIGDQEVPNKPQDDSLYLLGTSDLLMSKQSPTD
jgi:Kelch motif